MSNYVLYPVYFAIIDHLYSSAVELDTDQKGQQNQNPRIHTSTNLLFCLLMNKDITHKMAISKIRALASPIQNAFGVSDLDYWSAFLYYMPYAFYLLCQMGETLWTWSICSFQSSRIFVGHEEFVLKICFCHRLMIVCGQGLWSHGNIFLMSPNHN